MKGEDTMITGTRTDVTRTDGPGTTTGDFDVFLNRNPLGGIIFCAPRFL